MKKKMKIHILPKIQLQTISPEQDYIKYCTILLYRLRVISRLLLLLVVYTKYTGNRPSRWPRVFYLL